MPEKETSEANPPSLHPIVRISELWVGDRFIAYKSLWTNLGASGDGIWATARKHCTESIALGRRGYGYIGDTICSFKLTDRVRFMPVDNPNCMSSEKYITKQKSKLNPDREG